MQDIGRNSNKDSNMDNDMNNNANNNVNEQPLSDDKVHIHHSALFSCSADDCAGQLQNHFSCAVDSEPVCYRSVFNRSRVCGL